MQKELCIGISSRRMLWLGKESLIKRNCLKEKLILFLYSLTLALLKIKIIKSLLSIAVELLDSLPLKFSLTALLVKKSLTPLTLKNLHPRKNTEKHATSSLWVVFFTYCKFTSYKSLTNRMAFWGNNKNELLKQNVEVNIDLSSK